MEAPGLSVEIQNRAERRRPAIFRNRVEREHLSGRVLLDAHREGLWGAAPRERRPDRIQPPDAGNLSPATRGCQSRRKQNPHVRQCAQAASESNRKGVTMVLSTRLTYS